MALILQLIKNTSTHFSPFGKTQLNHLANAWGQQVPIDRMIVCYSRAPNFGNQFSYQKICKQKGPKVSSYLWLDISKPLYFQVTRGSLCDLKNNTSKFQVGYYGKVTLYPIFESYHLLIKKNMCAFEVVNHIEISTICADSLTTKCRKKWIFTCPILISCSYKFTDEKIRNKIICLNNLSKALALWKTLWLLLACLCHASFGAMGQVDEDFTSL